MGINKYVLCRPSSTALRSKLWGSTPLEGSLNKVEKIKLATLSPFALHALQQCMQQPTIHHLHCTHALKNCHLHIDVNVSIIIHCTSGKGGHHTIRPICYLDSQGKQMKKKKRWSWVGGGRRRWGENTIAIQVHSQLQSVFCHYTWCILLLCIESNGGSWFR